VSTPDHRLIRHYGDLERLIAERDAKLSSGLRKGLGAAAGSTNGW
jgi:hypothetical protein